MADDSMLTSFANLYVTRPRETEHGDTRHEIRRHDPEQEKRKDQGEEKKSGPLFNEEDYAVVSVEALRLFLKNFLGTQEPDSKRPAYVAPENEPPAENKQIQGQAAHAASAYAHASETRPGAKISPAPQAPVQAGAPNAKLPAEEIRVILGLLEDLKILAEQKIEYLRIERGESFLQSLVIAVAKAQAFNT